MIYSDFIQQIYNLILTYNTQTKFNYKITIFINIDHSDCKFN